MVAPDDRNLLILLRNSSFLGLAVPVGNSCAYNSVNKSLVSPDKSPKSIRIAGCTTNAFFQSNLESFTLDRIATCTLILHQSRTRHSSSSANDRDTPTDGSCFRVARVRPHHAFIGDYPFAFDAFVSSRTFLHRPSVTVTCNYRGNIPVAFVSNRAAEGFAVR